MLIAGILTTRLTLDFLFLGQWQRPEAKPPALEHLTAASSIELDLRLSEDAESGGLPADETWDRFVIWKPDERDDGCKLSVSPVRDEMKEPAGDGGAFAAKLMVVNGSFRSIVFFAGWWWWGSGGRH